MNTATVDSSSVELTCHRQTALPFNSMTYHTHLEVNLIRKGWVKYLHGGNEIRAGTGKLIMFWAAVPHQIVEASADAEYYVLAVPMTWFLQCRLPESFTRLVLNGQIAVDPQECSHLDSETFERWIADLRTQQPARQRMVMLEVEARLLRCAVATASRTQSGVQNRDTFMLCDRDNVDRIRQMLCFIAQNYTEQITVELIGKAAGFHPNYAMNLFRKTFGTTLGHYLTQHRVSHAQRLLATSDQKVVDVALNSGFNSLSRFNDVFKKVCGCSPREYRHRCRDLSLN